MYTDKIQTFQKIIKIRNSQTIGSPFFGYVIISQHNFVINLCLRFISPFGRFYDDFTIPFTLSLYPFHLSIPFTSLSLSYLSLPLFISPSTFLFLSLLLSLFSLSFSLAYLMDVFVLVEIRERVFLIFLNRYILIIIVSYLFE